MSVRSRSVAIVALALVATLAARPAAAHVDYVTEGSGDPIDAVAFTAEVLSDPFNAALFAGSGLLVTAGIAAYLWVRPTIVDVVVLREKLASYGDLVAWMLRLAVGLPLVGAGFQGYLFAPTLSFDTGASPLLRVLFIGLGFCLLFGLATRIVSTVGLLTYAWVFLAVDPIVVLAVEYVPVFVALAILGGGRPSADDMLLEVASTPGSYYGRIDPVHHLKGFLDESTAPLRRYVPTVLRVGMGISFVYLGLIQKLADPGSALLVVEKYGLTSVVPVDAGLWVVGAGVTEIAVGVALIAGFFTRGAAALSFVLFTTTLFGLPDDPVLAHVALFGMASAVFTLGSGPLAFDHWFGRPALDDDEAVIPAD
ncbi:DoxX family protein [Halorubrum sp. Ib24]|uniref:DoxX family protein n=1 Tax=unclassified Halorubrum TaxID=2642239 RepID=UPI000B99C622|nr:MULTISPECIES: DoxX family protein [unclassified Halorubrum]OYR39761.1 DoxX family protein [Halorubrum sp. Hd13]OYR40915.1 DoxX family protein [Halorubrum sp. Eb13]OYR42082.1 DoxX family protein [Halorubrum sp. Ib24]OYR48454.1 DoxX family protein [Halorubrum sp. Ea8]OYR50629.1 DoxX family protein [Halorubrum sp. Ea1]